MTHLKSQKVFIILTLILIGLDLNAQKIIPKSIALTQQYIKENFQSHEVGNKSVLITKRLYFDQQVVKKNNINSYLEIVAVKHELENSNYADKLLIFGIINLLEGMINKDTSILIFDEKEILSILDTLPILFDLYNIKSKLISGIRFYIENDIFMYKINYKGVYKIVTTNRQVDSQMFNEKKQKFIKSYSIGSYLNEQIDLLKSYGISSYEKLLENDEELNHKNLVLIATGLKESKEKKDDSLKDFVTQKTYVDYTFNQNLIISVEHPNTLMLYLWIDGIKHRIPYKLFLVILNQFIEF